MFPRRLFLLLLAALSAGCAAIPANRGYGTVEALVAERGAHAPVINAGNDAARLDALVLDTLSRPLRARDAVEIALLKNPTLRRGYAELGIAQAELYDAARLSNPTLSLAWLDSNESGAADFIGVGLSQDFLCQSLPGSRSLVCARAAMHVLPVPNFKCNETPPISWGDLSYQDKLSVIAVTSGRTIQGHWVTNTRFSYSEQMIKVAT